MLGKYIKECREARNMSCSELARLTGHAISTINGIERGINRNPRFAIICAISDVLDIDIKDLKDVFCEWTAKSKKI